MARRPREVVEELDLEEPEGGNDESSVDIEEEQGSGRRPARKTKLRAHKKWEELKKKQRAKPATNTLANDDEADSTQKPAKAPRGRMQPEKKGAKTGNSDYLPPDISLNTSNDEADGDEDEDEDVPKTQHTKETVKSKSSTKEAKAPSQMEVKASGTKEARSLKAAKLAVEKNVEDSDYERSDQDSDEELSDEEEEDEILLDEGALQAQFDAEAPNWAADDVDEGFDGNPEDDAPPSRRVFAHNASPPPDAQEPHHPSSPPPTHKRLRTPLSDGEGHTPKKARGEVRPEKRPSQDKTKTANPGALEDKAREKARERAREKAKARAAADAEEAKAKAKTRKMREGDVSKSRDREKKSAKEGKGKGSMPADEGDEDEDEDADEKKSDKLKTRGKASARVLSGPSKTDRTKPASAAKNLGSGKPRDKPVASGPGVRKPSASKRKVDEVITWADKREEDEGTAKGKPSKKRRTNVGVDSDDDAMVSDAEDQDPDIEVVWEGNKQPNLLNQPPRVRRVARLAIVLLKKNVLLKHAFPEGSQDSVDYARNALIRCSTDVGYRDMTKRLKDDNQEAYWRKFSSLPSQRVFAFRGSVKKVTDGAVAGVYGVSPGDSVKIDWLQDKLAYVCPHDYTTKKVQGKEAYTLPIFESIMRTAFYDNPRSFGYRVLAEFESSRPDRPHEKEISAPMLALAATAVHASLDDFWSAKYRAGKFEANAYTGVYRRHIAALNKLKEKQPNKYHNLMHGFFHRLTGGTDATDNVEVQDTYLDFSGDDDE